MNHHGTPGLQAFQGDILILDRNARQYRDLLAAALPNARLHAHESPAGPDVAEAASASAIWLASCSLAVDLLARQAPPRWLQTTSAGIEPLFSAGVPQPALVSRAVGVFGQLMAEYALTYMLAWRRQVFAWAGAQRRGDWDGPAPGTLAGLRVLVAGAGEIGQDVARLLAPFGVALRGLARQARPLPGFAQVYGLDALDSAAAWADVFINILPDTPQTRDIYDASFFAALPEGALFINMGRGVAVVEPDLVQALECGHLGAAAIDVCREEPPPAAHPFWRAPRLWLTGHSAGPTLPALLAPVFLENLRRFEAGEPLRGAVDFTRGY
ncbi:D-2-hydroxyacid dehydrogenase [Kerstersia gyiorum]|uniref:D-isomer specific 2-hydroxyacid dehydrogenase NAD-binding domain-containing protein n=1 Tax=Kerstersia gyiorum TaxID=206506 RepID=A0A171KRS9_9BURK|nr:D-2-hydroxyacid dehydrogenase [Kerstersia gyiorum]KKO71596.1 hypothetical protein AAV32_10400 [Kerstersia gyiorum]MCP1638079.1 phosphoglycerate dehydrogenase-like enzyme [Kerstersia gyiorum]MCP1672513.1 phosphoglycerate dehydrogenase-like enzyme [Kerstersia gyiorum]MCP1680097.1 phosphoglycerate dehydrogenase-like enzyme [Kerstersia gyiorum]MCP1710511.1 phosphoglycerate dehydrogenase-like enzyme [Kerstersia gyiorum]